MHLNICSGHNKEMTLSSEKYSHDKGERAVKKLNIICLSAKGNYMGKSSKFPQITNFKKFKS